MGFHSISLGFCFDGFGSINIKDLHSSGDPGRNTYHVRIQSMTASLIELLSPGQTSVDKSISVTLRPFFIQVVCAR